MNDESGEDSSRSLAANLRLKVTGWTPKDRRYIKSALAQTGPSPMPWADPVIEEIRVAQGKTHGGITVELSALKRYEFAFAVYGDVLLDDSNRQTSASSYMRGSWRYPNLLFAVEDSQGHRYSHLQGAVTGAVREYGFISAFGPRIHPEAREIRLHLSEIEWKVMDSIQEVVKLPEPWVYIISL